MSSQTMHADEVAIDARLVRRLLVEQYADWAELPLTPIHPTGTVNAVFRLGAELCVRLPRLRAWAHDLEKELQWLPILAPRISLSIPEPLAVGKPGAGYPFAWAVYRWLPGAPLDRAHPPDDGPLAERLAQFILELRQVEPAGAPQSRRDRPLPLRDAESRAAIASARRMIDVPAVTAAWQACLQAPPWQGQPVWTHGDLLPPNLLLAQGQLTAVIDFGNLGVGDPAVDVIPAWSVLGKTGRRVFRAALGVDDAAWLRGQGFALHQALLIIPYYRETNPAFAAMALRTLSEIVADRGGA